jgi:biopolymer transport protein ExbD
MSSDDALFEDDDAPVGFEKKNLADGEMDITPMIDIVFLLLIFFVVCSKMTAEQAPKVPAAKNGLPSNVASSIALILKRGNGETARVSTEEGRSFDDNIEQQTAEIIEYVTAEMQKGKQDVLLRAEGDVTNGETNRVKEAISEVLEEGAMINISVTQEQ